MYALEQLHAALRPQGALLDVRPAPHHPWVETHQLQYRPDGNDTNIGKRVVRIGRLDDSYRIGTQAIADAALQTLADTGRFVHERSVQFTFVYHFSDVESWLAYAAEHWETIEVDAEVIARARQELAKGPGEIRVLRAIHAARWRRR